MPFYPLLSPDYDLGVIIYVYMYTYCVIVDSMFDGEQRTSS